MSTICRNADRVKSASSKLAQDEFDDFSAKGRDVNIQNWIYLSRQGGQRVILAFRRLTSHSTLLAHAKIASQSPMSRDSIDSDERATSKKYPKTVPPSWRRVIFPLFVFAFRICTYTCQNNIFFSITICTMFPRFTGKSSAEPKIFNWKSSLENKMERKKRQTCRNHL